METNCRLRNSGYGHVVTSDWKLRGYEGEEEEVGLLPVLLEVIRRKLHSQEWVISI